MKAKINHITQFKGNNRVNYNVYYESGRMAGFTEKDNLPNSVLLFMVNSEMAETTTTTTGTITRFY